MTGYLPWLLLLLACPLMMFFMMRGMSGGKNSGRDVPDKNTDDSYWRPEPHQPASTPSSTEPAQDRARIADLERENADLRAARDHPSGSSPTDRRWTH